MNATLLHGWKLGCVPSSYEVVPCKKTNNCPKQGFNASGRGMCFPTPYKVLYNTYWYRVREMRLLHMTLQYINIDEHEKLFLTVSDS